MTSPKEERIQSDRSLLSMVVDAAVSKPERHGEVFAHIPVEGDVQTALEILKGAFERVHWQKLGNTDQLEALEQIRTQLDSRSPAGELAVRALHWGLQNRKHRRPQVARNETSSNVDDLDLEKFM